MSVSLFLGEVKPMRSCRMTRLPLLPACPLLAFILAAGSGCDGKPAVDTSEEEVTVTGSVKVMGKTPKKGMVRFDPSNYKRVVTPREAPIEKDGTYSIKTLVGRNQVSVSVPSMNLSRDLDGVEYRYDARPGSNTYDIVLPPN